jgi:hypothetical protein
MTVPDIEIVRLEESNKRLSRDNANLAIEIQQLQAKLKFGQEQLVANRLPVE